MNKRTALSDRKRHSCRYRPLVELLEARLVFASDFGDAPLPYKTLLAEGGAEHIATGPTLGAQRDTEADGVHSPGADGDDTTGSPDDEDGVTFGTIRAGALGATATVNVAGVGGNLDAWIDFDGDGAWGGPLEQIADRVAVVGGSNTISFDVPSTARDGTTYARFRLSGTGNLGVSGVAPHGEVEDYAVTIKPPKKAAGFFDGQNVVSTGANGAADVFAADVDSDGDTDILSASVSDDKIAWYENNGDQIFTAHTITTDADAAYSLMAADIDGDGDMDVLSAGGGTISWYENDGDQNFLGRTITTTAFNVLSVYAADIDGDGDIDVQSASFSEDKIAWYENDGSQNFATHILSLTANGATGVFAADMDGDGNMDVLSSSYNDDKIVWYRNDGNQNFTAYTITGAANKAISVFAADVDDDGDTDILSGSYEGVRWYENIGAEGFTAHLAAGGWGSVFASDMDGDGDTDIFCALRLSDVVYWFENNGSQTFTSHKITTAADSVRSVFVADVDGDGDLDVLSASAFDDKIAWYENQRFKKTGVQSEDAPDPIITPLPIPPPPGPIGQMRHFGDATVGERPASVLSNSRGSEVAPVCEPEQSIRAQTFGRDDSDGWFASVEESRLIEQAIFIRRLENGQLVDAFVRLNGESLARWENPIRR